MTSISRRAFLSQAFKLSLGLPLSRALGSFKPAIASTVKDEQQKERLAKYIFNFSSPYFTSDFKTTPHAHIQIKQIIEKYTENKITVKIHDGGVNGIGTPLSNHVGLGFCQGGLISVSNLTPLIKELDILNIPFWSSDENEYLRLFNSQAWVNYVLSKAKRFNLKILFPYVVGARTATTIKKNKKMIKAPEDFEGITFRIPGSESLALFYQLAKAKPVKIPWAFCARTARAGHYDALDPSVLGLYAGPDGLRKEIGIISQIASVHDGWVAIGNLQFIEALDPKTRIQFLDAFEEIQALQVELYHKAKAYCISQFEELGAKIYTPTPKEKKTLADRFGHTNPAWEPIKKKLLGEKGLAVFDELFKIAKDGKE